MSNKTNILISEIYKSRKNILDLMEKQNYKKNKNMFKKTETNIMIKSFRNTANYKLSSLYLYLSLILCSNSLVR